MAYCPSNLISKSIYHRSTSFPSQYTIDRINGLLLASSKFGQRQFVMKNKPGALNQSETAKCFLINKKSYVDLRMCYPVLTLLHLRNSSYHALHLSC